jgi:polar amino acid transport system substrate-binding protein
MKRITTSSHANPGVNCDQFVARLPSFLRSLFCVLTCLPLIAPAQDRLQITTEDATPLSMTKDEGKAIYGEAADKVHELLKRSHIAYDMQITNWNRAIELAYSQVNTCVFSTARTPEREARFNWIGPIAKGDWVIVGTSEKSGKITQLEQIKSGQIGVYRGDAVGEMLVHRGYHVMTSNSDEITIRNMMIGRLDYWASDSNSAVAQIAKDNLQSKLSILFTFARSDYYLACNPQISSELITRMKNKLEEMKEDGTLARIDAKYSQ